jgi:hypothetical protein
MQHLLERASAIGVAAQGAVRERLEDFELFTALLAAVLVGGHSAIYQGARGTVVILTLGAFRPFRSGESTDPPPLHPRVGETAYL